MILIKMFMFVSVLTWFGIWIFFFAWFLGDCFVYLSVDNTHTMCRVINR